MTKQKSKTPKLKNEADKPDLKPLKKIKKHKSDKPPEPLSLNPEKLTPDSEKKKKKKKHKLDEPTSVNPEKLDSKTPDLGLVETKKKKKHKSDEPKSLNPEKLDVEAPDSDSVQSLKKKKKKKKKKKCNALDSDAIQPTKKKKKKKKQKSDKPQSPNPEIFDSKTPDSDLTQTLVKKKKKKKQKTDKPQKPHSPSPEKIVCEIDADSFRTPKKKKPKLDKSHPLNPAILDSEIDTVSVQTRKKKRIHELDKPQSPKPEKLDSDIGTGSIQTPKKKMQKLDECKNTQSVNPEFDIDSIQNLLEPHTKDQLIEFLLDSAVKTPSISSRIIETANQDISHRRIFVHNLDWDTTRESVSSVFEQFGELEACDVVYDRATGKTKGFGFVIFKSRECAKNALKEPKKRIDNRIVSCQFASIGPPVVGCVDNSSRKIYVSNVEKDVDSGKLREFFEKFGEIEAGPLGFDMQTGKSKGYALFVYKNLEGVRKVLEEPNKIFDGKQLNCRLANDWNGRKKNIKSDSSVTTVMMPVPHDLSAVLPKQNMAMVGQQAGLNPMLGQLGFNSIADGLYANPSAGLLNQLWSQAAEGLYANPSAGLLNQEGLYANPSAGLLNQEGLYANPSAGLLNQEGLYANPSAGLLNQLLSQAAEGLYANPSAGLLNQLLSQAGIGANQFGQMGVGLAGYGEAMTGQGMGSSAWNQSVLGSFSGTTSAPMLQGWQHAYSDT